MSRRGRARRTGSLEFSHPVAIPEDRIVLSTVEQAIRWLDGQGKRKVKASMREVAWRLRDARDMRHQRHVDKAGDRLAEALAASGRLGS